MTASSPAWRPPAAVAAEVAHLRPVTSADYAFLYELCTQGENLWRWRYRGHTPSPEAFLRDLWDDVLAQFLVEDPRSGQPAGLVVAASADHRNGNVYVSAVATPEARGTGLVAAGAALLVDHLFRMWDFHKVCMEVPAFNLGALGSGVERWFEEEGRLRDHVYLDGRRHDVHLLALTRARWEAVSSGPGEEQSAGTFEELLAWLGPGAAGADRSTPLAEVAVDSLAALEIAEALDGAGGDGDGLAGPGDLGALTLGDLHDRWTAGRRAV